MLSYGVEKIAARSCFAIERRLRQSQHAAVRAALGHALNAAQRLLRTQPGGEFEQRSFAFAEHDTIERPELEHELRTERRLHAAGDEQCVGRQAARKMGELEVETQRHARRGHANHVPGVAQDFAFERALQARLHSSSDRRL